MRLSDLYNGEMGFLLKWTPELCFQLKFEGYVIVKAFDFHQCPGDSPHKGTVMQNFNIFVVVSLIKLYNKYLNKTVSIQRQPFQEQGFSSQR